MPSILKTSKIYKDWNGKPVAKIVDQATNDKIITRTTMLGPNGKPSSMNKISMNYKTDINSYFSVDATGTATQQIIDNVTGKITTTIRNLSSWASLFFK